MVMKVVVCVFTIRNCISLPKNILIEFVEGALMPGVRLMLSEKKGSL